MAARPVRPLPGGRPGEAKPPPPSSERAAPRVMAPPGGRRWLGGRARRLPRVPAPRRAHAWGAPGAAARRDPRRWARGFAPAGCRSADPPIRLTRRISAVRVFLAVRDTSGFAAPPRPIPGITALPPSLGSIPTAQRSATQRPQNPVQGEPRARRGRSPSPRPAAPGCPQRRGAPRPQTPGSRHRHSRRRAEPRRPRGAAVTQGRPPPRGAADRTERIFCPSIAPVWLSDV